MTKSAIYLGVGLVVFGILLLTLTKFHMVSLIYGSASIIIGISLIIFNKEEDKVEQRKDLKSSKTKK